MQQGEADVNDGKTKAPDGWRGIGVAAVRAALAIAACIAACVAALPPAAAAGGAADLPASRREDALVRLGARLFFDQSLSADGRVSCASCHVPERAFSDGLPLARGLRGAVGLRNTPSLIGVAQHAPLFWDGRRETLEAQAADPFVHPGEHGLASPAQLLGKLRADRSYRTLARAAYGRDHLSAQQAYAALAAFQRGLDAGPSAFDRSRDRHHPQPLPAAAARGLALFTGHARCAECHLVAPGAAPLTDNRFHALGVGLGPLADRMPQLLRRAMARGTAAAGEDAGKALVRDPELAALGRFLVTGDPQDIGAFRTPGLRNAAVTAPYMHDGSIATLGDAVAHEIHYRGLQAGRPLILTQDEQADLVAFLESLTGEGRDRLARDSRDLARAVPRGSPLRPRPREARQPAPARR